MFDLVKKTPVVTIGLLVAAQLAALLPFLSVGKIRPLFFVYLHEVSLVDLTPTVCFALGHALAVAGALLISRAAVGKWGLRIVGAIALAHFLAMVVAVLYYGNFGQYPRHTLIADLWITPIAVVGYGISGATLSDFVLGMVAAAMVTWTTGLAILRVNRDQSPGDAGFLSAAMAIGCLTIATTLISERGAFGALRVCQFHGIPSALIWGSIADVVHHNPDNQPEQATEFLPITKVSQSIADFERPDHIILIVMESFRADHVPAYGYRRNTMPRLQQDQENWVIFPHYRSSAPMTAASLRAMLSSKYLQLGSNENSINANVAAFWNAISRSGYQTAFLTGADMRWHYLDQVTKAESCDEFFHYHTVDPATRERHILRDRMDGSLNDALVIQHAGDYLDLARRQNQSTVTVMYLLNLHQPYYSDPEDRKFSDSQLPKVVADQRLLEMELSESHRVALSNQYDNSIINFDKNLSNLLTNMRHRGILERSVVLVTGDHGEAFGDHGTYYHGTTVYDEQIKVPLMVRVGNQLPKLRQVLISNRDSVATGVDLGPTILSMTGSRLPETFEGTPLTARNRKQYDFVFWTAGYQMAAVFTTTRKYIYDMETRIALGFDLTGDPSELQNTFDGSFENFGAFLNYLRKHQIIQRDSDTKDTKSTAIDRRESI